MERSGSQVGEKETKTQKKKTEERSCNRTKQESGEEEKEAGEGRGSRKMKTTGTRTWKEEGAKWKKRKQS